MKYLALLGLLIGCGPTTTLVYTWNDCDIYCKKAYGKDAYCESFKRKAGDFYCIK